LRRWRTFAAQADACLPIAHPAEIRNREAASAQIGGAVERERNEKAKAQAATGRIFCGNSVGFVANMLC
jgi:hypothetical protein